LKYRAIATQSGEYPVVALCRVLGVSRSGYYAWRCRPVSRRRHENEVLLQAILRIHTAFRARYGSPRIYRELLAEGYRCGLNRVARLMQQAGILARRTVRFRTLTKSSSRGWSEPNLLNRGFTVSHPNRVWAADISYIPTGEGHLYLAVVIDLYSRLVVGWTLGERLGATLVISALQQALAWRRPAAGLLHHSDRDGLYASAAYQRLLAEHQLRGSMSRKGNCYDNACVESFFASLKNELVHEERYRSREQARLSIFEYIEVFYNRRRRHSTLDYLSPLDFERTNKHA
jgi:transposase InsO family protein